MSKIAKLVVTTFISRVLVDETMTSEQIADLAKVKIQDKLNNNEVYENIECIMDDTECPYGTFEDELSRCPVCGGTDTIPDPDFPQMMYNCKTCGSEWTLDREVTLNGREL